MKKIVIIIVIILCVFITYILYHFNIIPNFYSNKYEYLNTYKSMVDKDGDLVDDQTDILLNAKEYISTKPKYKSKYYNSRLS